MIRYPKRTIPRPMARFAGSMDGPAHINFLATIKVARIAPISGEEKSGKQALYRGCVHAGVIRQTSVDSKTNISKRSDFGKEYRLSFLATALSRKFWFFRR
jgi:hypothetical protein